MANTETTVDLVEPWVPEDTFGARLALIRQRMYWNVKQAAEGCGLNYQSWHNWEHGGLPRDLVGTARQIARATGCNERWLVLGEKWTKNKGADLQVLEGEADDTRAGPGQLELPFVGLKLITGGRG